ncbi:uncharacterized protein LOC129790869 [Lutzomyia longipalpis]|uniref:uncharacterized protein LOC129790869 n=1 Tax=Lutzomyia longipalpis TaxID=7200 RepID=UPI00248388EF|nr:uncharacterized protein LOC129790869 [Lutzomyia longipalpis]
MEYYVILQFKFGDDDHETKFCVVSGRSIANIGEVNPETCRPGMEVNFKIADVLVAGVVVDISDDFKYIEDQSVLLHRNIVNQRMRRPEAIEQQKGPVIDEDVAVADPEATIRPEEHLMEDDAKNADEDEPDVVMQTPQENQSVREEIEEPTQAIRYDPLTSAQVQTANYFMRLLLVQCNSNGIRRLLKIIISKQNSTVKKILSLKRKAQLLNAKAREMEEKKRNTVEIPTGAVLLNLPQVESDSNENVVLVEIEPNQEEQETSNVVPIAAEESEPGRSRKTLRSETSAVESKENTSPNAKRFKAAEVPNDVKKSSTTPQLPTAYQREEDIVIGSNGTKINAVFARGLDWDNDYIAIRRVAVKVFGKKTLATHSLSGKRSPAFPDRAAKPPLDPRKVDDIIEYAMRNADILASAVRRILTAKCADENKMQKNNTSSKSSKKGKKSKASSPADEPRAGSSNTSNSSNTDKSSNADKVDARDSSSPGARPDLNMSFKKRIMKNFQAECNKSRNKHK